MHNLDVQLTEDSTGGDTAQGLAIHPQSRKAVGAGLDDPLHAVERCLRRNVPQAHSNRTQSIVDVVDWWWTGNRTIEEVDLDNLDQVFGEVAKLQDGENAQKRDGGVVLDLPHALEHDQRDPRQQRYKCNHVQRFAGDNGVQLQHVRDRCGDQHDPDVDGFERKEAEQ